MIDKTKLVEELKNLHRRTINGCWYVELGSVENLFSEKLEQALEEQKKEIRNGIQEFIDYPKKSPDEFANQIVVLTLNTILKLSALSPNTASE